MIYSFFHSSATGWRYIFFICTITFITIQKLVYLQRYKKKNYKTIDQRQQKKSSYNTNYTVWTNLYHCLFIWIANLGYKLTDWIEPVVLPFMFPQDLSKWSKSIAKDLCTLMCLAWSYRAIEKVQHCQLVFTRISCTTDFTFIEAKQKQN